jgi:23S rRNA pseudouridine955/2504/2580 synthase
MKHNLTFDSMIIAEEAEFIIVNKPPFLSTLDDRSSPDNLLEMARAYHNEAQVCHRLDKETSGLLVVAKTNDFYKYFSSLLENRDVTKMYHAIVEGRHELEEIELDKPIYTGSNKSRVDFQQGKPSLTLITTVEIFKQHTLIACMPFTGRLHQIRVHLADQGTPICGDEMYGGRPIFLSSFKRNFHLGKNKEERPLMSRVSLHAAALSFENTNGDKLTFKAPYPKDLQATLRQLTKNKL